MTTVQKNSNVALWPGDDFEDVRAKAPSPAPEPEAECAFDRVYDGAKIGTSSFSPTYPKGSRCFGGVRFDTVGQAHSCRCEAVKASRRAIPPDLGVPSIEQARFVLDNRDLLASVVRTGSSKDDVLASATAYHLMHQFQSRSDVVVATDRAIVGWQTATWNGGKDDDAPSFEDVCDAPRLLVIVLGDATGGPGDSPKFLLDAIRLRRNRERATWIVVPQRRPWIASQEASADLNAELAKLANAPFPAATREPAAAPLFADEATPVVATQPAKPKAKATVAAEMVAKYAGRCAVCDKGIRVGDPFVWAGDDKKRSHPACGPAVQK